jgi:hypothetical protein
MKRKKITVDEIRAIKAGETKVFHVPNVKDIRSAQVTAYRMKRFEPHLEVSFTTETDFDNLMITITAHKV